MKKAERIIKEAISSTKSLAKAHKVNKYDANIEVDIKIYEQGYKINVYSKDKVLMQICRLFKESKLLYENKYKLAYILTATNRLIREQMLKNLK